MSVHVLRRSLLPASASVAAALLLLAVFSPGHQGRVSPQPAHATFHVAVIDEVMTSYGGDTLVQFVEIRMLSIGQSLTTNSVLGAFDTSGGYLGDVLIVPGDVTSGAGPWLMATTKFTTVSGLVPDFVMPAGLPTGGGMVCWGAPGVAPPLPGSWDHTDPNLYVDCVAYGTYSGPTNIHIGTPTSLDGDGHSLQRLMDTANSANDFACADPATPTKDALTPLPTSVSLAATAACPPTPTPTPTPTPMATATPTATPTPTPEPCPPGDSDCDSLGLGNPLWFRDSIEIFVGTDPFNACADDTIKDNEADDKWPPDLNDDQAVNIIDRARYVSQLLSGIYDQRFDLNADGVLSIQDRAIEVLYVLEFQVTGSCLTP